MTTFRQFVKPATLMLALAGFMSVSGAARAETGWLWFDSVFAVPRAALAPVNRPQPVKRARIVRLVAPAPAPQPIVVSAAASEARPNCFWCGRPVYVSGLSF